MAGFTFTSNAARFVCRHPAGGAIQEVDLVFPDDFPGHPGLEENIQVEIQSVAVSLTTGGVAGSRRLKLTLLDAVANDQVLWYSEAQQAASINNRRFHFTSRGPQIQIAGLLNKEHLPIMVLGLDSTLNVAIQGVQAGDLLEEVIVQGRYLGIPEPS